MTERPVAAVDCGTNSTRLLIASSSGTLDRRMKITRLGQGVDETGELHREAVQRTLAVLGEYAAAMKAAGVGRVMVAATSAIRDAANAGDFTEPVERLLGTSPVVLAGTREGELSYNGATAELDSGSGPYLVMDVGGGSTELVTCTSASGFEAVSLDVGCVRVTERFFRTDPPRPEEIEAARAYVSGLVRKGAADHGAFTTATTLVGLAGTVSALARLALGLASYDRSAVHHATLARDDIADLLGELAGMPAARRRLRKGMEAERADVIVGGTLVVLTAMDALGYGSLLTSESDILDGMVAELLSS